MTVTVDTASVPAFKAALLAALRARPGLRNVQVTWGPPIPAPGPEFVWLADVDGEQAVAAIGQYKREENYSLTVYVNVVWATTDQQPVTERAFALAAELEDEIRNDPQMGDTVRVAEIAGPFALQEMASDLERGALLTITVTCMNRLS